MSYKLKVSSQNQITLPTSLLKELSLTSGHFVEIVKVNGKYVIQTFREVLAELDSLTKDLQVQTKKFKADNPSWDLDQLVDRERESFYNQP